MRSQALVDGPAPRKPPLVRRSGARRALLSVTMSGVSGARLPIRQQDGERLPHRISDALFYNSLSFLLPAALLVALLPVVGFDEPSLWVGALAVLAFVAGIVWRDLRFTRDNWISIGSETSALCVAGRVTYFANADVSHVRWVRGDVVESSLSSPTKLDLTVGEDLVEVELLFGLVSRRRRALRLATAAFSEASWIYDPNRMLGLRPTRTWGPPQ